MARPSSDLRSRIVPAARARFLTQGVDGASLRSIADDAGTSIGMVYYHFKTKDELFLAVVEDVYGELMRSLGSLLATDMPPDQRLRDLYQRFARMDEREFEVVRLILREALISSDRVRRLAQRFEQGHIPIVARAVGEGLAQGRFDANISPMVLIAATASLALLPQIVHRLISAAQLPIAAALPTREESARALSEVLLFGIAGPALRRHD
jgi:AcrR family transcriptional regulator